VLSPLQERVAVVIAGLSEADGFALAVVIAGLSEADGFALAGGAALIVRDVIQRGTRDLDFFGPSAVSVNRLFPAADQALRDAGLDVELVIVNDGFVRLMVSDGAERTQLDLATDARLFPAEQGPGYSMLSTEELAVDKVLAVFGRAEARDFMDLAALEVRFDLDHLMELAVQKDRGFTPAPFAESAAQFIRLRREEFSLSDEQYAALDHRVVEWRDLALELSQRPEWRIEPSRERGPDLGIGR
jgi:hypothetical protein